MRNAFFEELFAFFQNNDHAVFLTGDLGYKLFDPIKAIAPDRVLNVGIREASMVGFAAGLAKSGMLPFVYSIVPFISLRCIEQIKLDLCYNGQRAILVGVGGGYAYGPNGPTHHGTDDLGMFSLLPNMRVWTPADPLEVRACVRAAADVDGPAYLRLGRNGEPNLEPHLAGGLSGNTPRIIREGDDGVIVSCGVILHEVLEAVRMLESSGHRPKVIHILVFRPFPGDALALLLRGSGPIITVEEHVIAGGLGQEVACLIAESSISRPLRRLSIPQAFPDACFSREAALRWAGIDPESIVRAFLGESGS